MINSACIHHVVLPILQWETKNDDYGRVYYANWETGEAVYEPPPEMEYRPPLGRNELGQKVDPRLQALRWVAGVTFYTYIV